MTIDDHWHKTSNYKNNCYQASVTLAVLLQKTAGQQIVSSIPYYIAHTKCSISHWRRLNTVSWVLHSQWLLYVLFLHMLCLASPLTIHVRTCC